MHSFPVPLMIVGTKYDVYRVSLRILLTFGLKNTFLNIKRKNKYMKINVSVGNRVQRVGIAEMSESYNVCAWIKFWIERITHELKSKVSIGSLENGSIKANSVKHHKFDRCRISDLIHVLTAYLLKTNTVGRRSRGYLVAEPSQNVEKRNFYFDRSLGNFSAENISLRVTLLPLRFANINSTPCVEVDMFKILLWVYHL